MFLKVSYFSSNSIISSILFSSILYPNYNLPSLHTVSNKKCVYELFIHRSCRIIYFIRKAFNSFILFCSFRLFFLNSHYYVISFILFLFHFLFLILSVFHPIFVVFCYYFRKKKSIVCVYKLK